MLCDKLFPTAGIEVIILPVLSNIFYWYVIVKSVQNSRRYDLLIQANHRILLDRHTAGRKVRINDGTVQIAFIQSYIRENKNYLDKDFALPALAAELNIPANKLSAVINDIME